MTHRRSSGEASFNPSLVRLEAVPYDTAEHYNSCFNPSLVRLEDAPYNTHRGRANKFQSQSGAIRGQRLLGLSVPVTLVSIPVWCD